jgi:hypothetical protein
MSTEVCTYRLTLRGKPVGSHTISTTPQGRLTLLEANLMLQGPLGTSTVVQRSKVHRHRFVSLSFSEETQEHGSKRHFQVHFDPDSGLVTASKGPNDRTEMPLTQGFLDPLSLLYRLRFLTIEEDNIRLPLLGKPVTVECLNDTPLDTALGRKQACVYQLHPGGSLVYIDKDEPKTILMLSQRFDNQLLDAHIVNSSQEDVSEERSRDPKRNRPRQRRHYRGKPRG